MEIFGKMTVKDLKETLKERGASVKGKKKDLIQRLVFYEENHNFRTTRTPGTQEEEVQALYMPDFCNYKDVNSATNLPDLDMLNIKNYLNRFDANIQKGQKLYHNSYLLNIRMAQETNMHFFSAQCKASMKKSIIYHVHIHISGHGEIEACQCDCSAGEPPHAHCKHVMVLLLAIQDAKRSGKYNVQKSTTQTLQTFNRPKPYHGSPRKAKKLPGLINSRINFEPVKTVIDSKKYNERVRNLCVNFASHKNTKMPFLHTIKPANIYAVVADHDYLSADQSPENVLLTNLKLKNVSNEDIDFINSQTTNQDNSRYWHDLHKTHLTSSKFHTICKAHSDTAKLNLAKRILNPVPFKTKQTQHGQDCEPKAIQAYSSFGVEVQKCGLILMKEKPYLGASPDGLIGSETVLEIKCPYNQRFYEISEETIPYLWKNDDDLLYLEAAHPYYYQIQGQLMITGRKFANLLVYTFVDWKIIDVPRNDKFIKTMNATLTSYYEEYFKPQLVNKYLYKSYDSIKWV